MTPGLTPTLQAPASAIATVKLGEGTVTEGWQALFENPDVQDAFVRALRVFANGRTVPDLYEALEERAVPYWLHSRIRSVAQGDRREAWRLVAEIIPNLGHGRSTIADIYATAGLFEAVSEAETPGSTPTIAVTVDDAFRELRRDQREDWCQLLATLARGLDVRLVATGRLQRWLAESHRETLPGVSEWCNTDPEDGPGDDIVETALEQLDPDGRAVATLRAIADEPAGTLPYSALYAQFEVGEARVRQCLGRLQELGLVASHGGQSGKFADLLAAGTETLAEIDRVYGRQETLENSHENWTNGGTGGAPKTGQSFNPAGKLERVSETGKCSPQCRVTPHARVGPPPERRLYRTRYLDRPNHVGAVAAGSQADVAVVEGRLPGGDQADDRHVRYVSYEDGWDEAVVAVRATGPCQYVVSVATALASPRFLDRALSVDRLESIDDPPAILRDARCIGALSDEALNEPQVLRDALVEWGDQIEDLTTDLHNGEYEDRDRFRGEILRSAHGLAGSIVHLLDVVGADLTVEVRVPDGLDNETDLQPLATSVGITAAIQSRYGAFASYRQLFEDRDEKRQSALAPDVDAADPVGQLIPSIVVRGPDVSRLRPLLEERVGSPRELHDDAPEFAVRTAVAEVGREAVATAVTRILDSKWLDSTRETVSFCHALVGTPHDAARALHQLASEDPRELRPDELRYALGTLGPECILPDAPPTVAAVITALLRATESLSQQELADRADVSARSIRAHRDALEALDLLRVDEQGYRLALSFRTAEERSAPIMPAPVADDATFVEALDALLRVTLSVDRYADPDDSVGGALFWPRDCWSLVDNPEYEPWVRLAARLTATASPDQTATVTMGPTIEQTALQETPA